MTAMVRVKKVRLEEVRRWSSMEGTSSTSAGERVRRGISIFPSEVEFVYAGRVTYCNNWSNVVFQSLGIRTWTVVAAGPLGHNAPLRAPATLRKQQTFGECIPGSPVEQIWMDSGEAKRADRGRFLTLPRAESSYRSCGTISGRHIDSHSVRLLRSLGEFTGHGCCRGSDRFRPDQPLARFGELCRSRHHDR